MTRRRARYQRPSSGPSEVIAAMASLPHQAPSQTLSPASPTGRSCPLEGSYTQMRRQRNFSLPLSTLGSHDGLSTLFGRLVTAPCPPETSAPCPATPRRIRRPSGDQCRYSIHPSVRGPQPRRRLPGRASRAENRRRCAGPRKCDRPTVRRIPRSAIGVGSEGKEPAVSRIQVDPCDSRGGRALEPVEDARAEDGATPRRRAGADRPHH